MPSFVPTNLGYNNVRPQNEQIKKSLKITIISQITTAHCLFVRAFFPSSIQSSMLLRFTDDSFDEHIQSTIGVDFKVKHLDVASKRIKLTIWDTAGQERFRTLTSSYYRGAQGVVMVYDVTRRDSFENLEQWLKEVKLYSPGNGEGVVKLLVGNKIDLKDNRKVSREEAEAWARSQGMLFLEASAKTRTGIKQCFMEVVHKIVEDPELLINTVPGRPKVTLYPDTNTRRVDGSGGNATGSGSMADDGSSIVAEIVAFGDLRDATNNYYDEERNGQSSCFF
eukprot:CAMPEP_0176490586 /NCGR_PEP_ID=MMETSP0200_2-20121128/7954_1 /TAXON_ID=947934 /ORGANISM="Chaetoceros sp., Strain GSL56" /LENGTH=279 /DNA_ID=CAMNT_0017887911 /DNA_START=532 /DNA_END=1369 /DNA_ORIENTATION=-